jgi:hypothetical protein
VTALLAVGIALVVFGAVVLLWFPDRPGGRIGWQGMEVSSVGAGLPVIVVGVVAVALGASGVGLGGGGDGVTTSGVRGPAAPASAPGCFRDYFEGIPAARVFSLEEGVLDRDVLGPLDRKHGPIGFRLTRADLPIGGVRVFFSSDNTVFRVESVVDGACRRVEDFENADRPEYDKHVIQNWDAMRVRLAGSSYLIDFGASDRIRISFYRVAES